MQKTIDTVRAEIETLDRELVKVLVARYAAVQKVAAAKASLGLPMHDAMQEEHVIARAKARADADTHGMITAVFRAMFVYVRGEQ
jgi:chorismate mutase